MRRYRGARLGGIGSGCKISGQGFICPGRYFFIDTLFCMARIQLLETTLEEEL